MNAKLLSGARRLRWLVFVMGAMLAGVAAFPWVSGETQSLSLKVISSGVLIAAATAWISVGWKGISTRRILTILIAANFVAYMAWNHGRRMERHERWERIYQKVGRADGPPFPIEEFGPFLNDTLRSGTLDIGVTSIWILNIFALMATAGSMIQPQRNQETRSESELRNEQ